MRKMSLSEWEQKYIAGPVERFDQRYNMYRRNHWDPEMKARLDNWFFLGEIKDRPGYTLKDFALRILPISGKSGSPDVTKDS